MNEAGWQEQSSTALPPFHRSSHGRWVQIEVTALTVSPRRNRKAPTPRAVTPSPCPSTRSDIAATSTHLPLIGLTSPPATRLVAPAGSSALPASPPATAVAARAAPAP